MKIAYLMNQYPYPSCTFIRREILGVEASGLEVTRFSIRQPEFDLLDRGDREEVKKTHFILAAGYLGLLSSLIGTLIARPLRMLSSIWLALRIGYKSDKGIIFHLAYLAEACILLRWLSKNQEIAHIHSHFATNATTVAMLCHKLGGPPYSFTVHGPHEFDDARGLALREKIERAVFVIAISSFTKSQLFRYCQYEHWSKIYEVHCGVDDLFFSQPYIALPEKPQFVCVGRLSEEKGHLLLVEAASQLAKEGFSFKLVFVGDGPLREKIEALIARFDLQEKIQITGWATNLEVQQHILDSQVLIQPSFAEGLPLVIMEALSLGRPILSTYIAGIPELVKDGVNGWLVPAGSREALVAAMGTIFHTPTQELAQMGKMGIEVVFEHFNSLKEADKLSQLLQKSVKFNCQR